MTNQKINIHNASNNVNAIGEFNSAHCKNVVCKEDGTVYTSIIDAANGAGVHYTMMSGHLRGKYKSVKGKHYAYLSDILDNPDVMFAQLRKTSAENATLKADAEDARKWREYQAKQEAEAIAEAKRIEDERKAKEKHDAKVAKMKAKVDKLIAACEKDEAKLEKKRAKLMVAQNQLSVLNGGVSDYVAA